MFHPFISFFTFLVEGWGKGSSLEIEIESEKIFVKALGLLIIL